MKEDNLSPWSTDNRLYKIGYWSGLAAGISTVAFTVFQTLQLFRVFPYPYDEISIYRSSLCIAVPFFLKNFCF